jgi:predicted nuclease of restriction endonuclease-like (RecB) superfamily
MTDLSKIYPRLLAEIKERVRAAQYEALKSVNKELVGLYWDIGRMIVERQIDAEHGSSIAEQLSRDLRQAFPVISGFSRRNIFYMREFYLLYRGDEQVQPLVAQIGWSHNLVILQRCKDKNRTVVEYALHDTGKPIGVATCEITRTLPKELQGQLPSPQEIARLLEEIEGKG